ncbi:hypothetical protein ATZ36_03920 [Candidatus Endomicrobiellum trichonymphae]|jgi:hypothetical protein|uniref:Uncharacterized protein n=1 Tax=Endomicrobium trichonymphae TaxID=1408204 RepID=A0A1E5IJK0_ENDTX|nr:hypothetical protein ATZ36_03920 [Candidatus Endomicrobium trichonymphae]
MFKRGANKCVAKNRNCYTTLVITAYRNHNKKMETKMNEAIKAKLIYADPSYGVGGGNYRYDCYKDKTFGERFYKLIEKCRELLTDDGSIWK